MATQQKTTAKKASPAKAKSEKQPAAIATPEPEAPVDDATPVTAEQETQAEAQVSEAPAEDPTPAAAEAETPEPKSEPVEQFCELADKDTGFYDPVTGFKVVRDQRMPLGEKVGKATRTAIVSGRLLVVGEK